MSATARRIAVWLLGLGACSASIAADRAARDDARARAAMLIDALPPKAD